MKYLIAISGLFLTALVAWMFFATSTAHTESFYGRALFGKDAADATAWLHFIVQGEQVFVDRNRNNVAEQDELFDAKTGIALSIGDEQFSLVAAENGIAPDAVSETLPQSLMLQVDVTANRSYRMSGKMHLVQSPEHCNWLHFGGNLQFLLMEQPTFRAGAESPAELKVFVGSVTNGPPGSPPYLIDSSVRPDTFRTTIIVPETKPPFPTVELKFTGAKTESESQPIDMDQFC